MKWAEKGMQLCAMEFFFVSCYERMTIDKMTLWVLVTFTHCCPYFVVDHQRLSFPIFSSRWSMEPERQLASSIQSKVSTLQIGELIGQVEKVRWINTLMSIGSKIVWRILNLRWSGRHLKESAEGIDVTPLFGDWSQNKKKPSEFKVPLIWPFLKI